MYGNTFSPVRGIIAMGVSDAVWEIECAIGDAFETPEHREARTRRNMYEQVLVDVDQLAGTEAMHTLSSWIEREIRTTGRLPKTHEVRQVATEICRRPTSAQPDI